jgi:hypothetical protein
MASPRCVHKDTTTQSFFRCPALLEGLWSQHQNRTIAHGGLALDLAGERVNAGAVVLMPKLASLVDRGGFAVDFWIKLKELTLRAGRWQHVAVIVDAGPRIVSFLVDGVFNDGGALREYGWGRFPKELGDVNAGEARIGGKLFGELARLRVYNRYLRTSEAVGNWRAGR